MGIKHYCIYDIYKDMFLELCYSSEPKRPTVVVGLWFGKFNYKLCDESTSSETVWILDDDHEDENSHHIFNSLIELGYTEEGRYDEKYLDTILLVPVKDMTPVFLDANYFVDRMEV